MSEGGLRVLAVGHQLTENSTGRAYALWLIARELGWNFSLVGPARAGLWEPVRGTQFAESCRPLPDDADLLPLLRRDAASADLLIAVKPLPRSLGVALRLHEELRVPLVADVDDPDIEVRTRVGSPPRLWRIARSPASRRLHLELRRLRWRLRSLSVTTSSPTLQRRYGGIVVPHVRVPLAPPVTPEGGPPVVAFVGTALPHKGTELLRQAVAQLADLGYTLTITDNAPQDALGHERWVGRTSVDAGEEIVRHSDIVAIPSLAESYGRAQLPVKLIDAMMAGRAVVASDLPPIRWALGGAGLLFRPGDEAGLTQALRSLADPRLRSSLGAAARRRAETMFTPAAVAPALRMAARRAGAVV